MASGGALTHEYHLTIPRRSRVARPRYRVRSESVTVGLVGMCVTHCFEVFGSRMRIMREHLER